MVELKLSYIQKSLQLEPKMSSSMLQLCAVGRDVGVPEAVVCRCTYSQCWWGSCICFVGLCHASHFFVRTVLVCTERHFSLCNIFAISLKPRKLFVFFALDC